MKYYTYLVKINENKYEVYSMAGVPIGEFIRDEAGYFSFWINQNIHGGWDDYILIELGNNLNKLNKEWDNIVNKELNG